MKLKDKLTAYKIINIIKNSGPMTKKGIANELNINVTTITRLVNDLTNFYNILKKEGKDSSQGGRKAEIFQINSKRNYVVGVDIGGKNLRILIVDLLGNITSYYREGNYKKTSAETMLNKILFRIDELCTTNKISNEKIIGMEISVSGCVNIELEQIIFGPNINFLKNYPIKNYLQKKINKPIFIEDSARCMAIAEKKHGLARNYDNFIFVNLGEDVGSGIYIDGKIYRGSVGIAGELGHVTVHENGPICKCGNKGCLEVLTSSSGIINRVKEGIENSIETSVAEKINGDYYKLSTELICNEAIKGDKFAFSIINKTGEYVGIGIAIALNLFASNLIVIGGGISNCGDILLNTIKRTVRSRVMNVISEKLEIVKSDLGEDIAALGAADDFLDKYFNIPLLKL